MVKDFRKLIGQPGTITVSAGGGRLEIPVIVLDVKEAYGRTRYQVEPVAGVGTVWVETVNIKTEG